MRFKEDVRDEAGEDLTDRQLVPLAQTTVDATPDEEAVYGVLAAMRKAATAASCSATASGRGRTHALIQYGLYKQFLSSPEACRKTVQKRMERVEEERSDQPRNRPIWSVSKSAWPV